MTTTSTAEKKAASARSQPNVLARTDIVPYGAPAYNEVMQFLIAEAAALDSGDFKTWGDCLADDIAYRMPIRETRLRSEGQGFRSDMNWFFENKQSLVFKIRRFVETDSAFAEDPPSRTRRFITNVQVFNTPKADEVVAESYLLLMRNRGEASNYDAITARREDLIRKTEKGMQVAQRTIYIDMSVLGTPNLAIFL